MNILLIGSGGREHALAWKLNQSPRIEHLYIAPGNAGTSQYGTNVDIEVTDFKKLGEFALQNNIHMVVVGPEDPLVKGIVDYFRQNVLLKKIPVIGPSAKASQLEGSKDFAKAFMRKYGIPTAGYYSVNHERVAEGMKFLESLNPPYVLKADGLAAGKGVLIIHHLEEAKKELNNMLNGKFGEAGKMVVIEEFLSGIELSVFILTDGKSYLILPEAKDYKRIGAGDTGPNTGGMGAVSPVSFAGKGFMNKVEEQIIRPTVKGLQSEGIEYKGFIFFGLINCLGNPYVIEYNARLGDPESQVVLPRIKSDLLDLFEAVANDRLNEKSINIDNHFVTTIVLASGGYPDAYVKGKIISGLEDIKDSMVFHAGTKQSDKHIVTTGGRVMAVSSYGNTMQEALAISNRNAANIAFENKYFRSDIGFDL